MNKGRGLPSEGISSRKAVTAKVAVMVARLQVNGVVVPIKVGLALEFLGAWLIVNSGSAWVWVFAIRVMSLHVGLPVVAALEELAADTTIVSGFLGCCPLSLLLDPVGTGKHRSCVEARTDISTGQGIELHRIRRSGALGPVNWAFEKILGGAMSAGDSRGIW